MISILPKTDEDINGIIHRMKRIKAKATCSTTRPKTGDRIFECNAPINISSPNFWYSGSYTIGQTYTVSFIDYIIRIKHYSVQVSNDVAFPKAWKLEGKGYNDQWELISTVSESKLNTGYRIRTFKVDKEGSYQHFRFTNTGNNYFLDDITYSNAFYLYKVDFFGFIKSPLRVTNNNCKRTSNEIYFISLIILSSQ